MWHLCRRILIQVPRSVVEPCHHWRVCSPSPHPFQRSGKALPSCQHTHRGPWLDPSEVSHLRRSPPVLCQNWPCIANASVLAGHPCSAPIRIYRVTRSPCSCFNAPPPAAYLSPSPSRVGVPLECESTLIFKKTGPSFLNYHLTCQVKWSSFSDDSQLS